MLVLFLVTVLGLATASLVPLAVTERSLTTISRETAECRFAAAAVAAYAIGRLQIRADWGGALDGSEPSPFMDAAGSVTLGGSRRVDLDGIATRLRPTAAGTWGPDEPRWTRFASGPVRALEPAALASRIHVAVWIADDERDGDRNPARDANGQVLLTAQAFGPVRGTSTVIVAVRREQPAPAPLRVTDWWTFE
jgi:hypothetical protein